MQTVDAWGVLTGVLGFVLERLGLDPFAYLVVTVVCIAIWIWYSVIGDVALTGRSLWMRRLTLLVAGFAAALFTYGASRLR